MNGRTRTPQQLQATLIKQFNMVELRQLAFALNIDDENLESKTKQDFVLSLIKYAQRRNLIEELWSLVENQQIDRPTRSKPSIWGQMSFGTKVTIISVLVTIIGIVVTLMAIFPDVFTTAPPSEILATPADKILVQVKVVSSNDQIALGNAKVSLDLADALFPQQRTDSTGLAIFKLPADVAGQIARITVELNGQVETQNITITSGMRAVEFQIRP